MTGVIIAAGRGERLRSLAGERPKTLIEINGKPMIQWIVDDLRSVGVDEFALVVGFAHEEIEEYFKEDRASGIHFVYNDRWEKGNGISVLAASDYLMDDGPFLLAMSDHLIEKRAYLSLMEMKNEVPVLLVDRELGRVFDIDDATKVMVEEKRITDIGKKISDYNGVDAGIFLLDRRIFPFLREAIERGEESLTAGIRAMIGEHPLTACAIPEGVNWIDVDSEEAYNYAMKMWRCS
jgi:choline kinase